MIFEKLYKELFAINRSLSSLPENVFFFQLHTGLVKTHLTAGDSTYFYFENGNYPIASFQIWNVMKNDARKKYIPQNIQDDLQKVEDYTISYFTSVEKFQSDVKEIQCREEDIKWQEKKKNYQRGDRSVNSESDIIYEKIYGEIIHKRAFIRGISVDDIVEDIVRKNAQDYKILETQEFINEIRKIITEILGLPSLKDTEKNFMRIKSSVSDALKNLDDLLQRITNEYEYGESL